MEREVEKLFNTKKAYKENIKKREEGEKGALITLWITFIVHQDDHCFSSEFNSKHQKKSRKLKKEGAV